MVKGAVPEIAEPTQCSSETGYFGVFFIQAHFWFVILSRPPGAGARTKNCPLAPADRMPRCIKVPHALTISSATFSASVKPGLMPLTPVLLLPLALVLALILVLTPVLLLLLVLILILPPAAAAAAAILALMLLLANTSYWGLLLPPLLLLTILNHVTLRLHLHYITLPMGLVEAAPTRFCVWGGRQEERHLAFRHNWDATGGHFSWEGGT